MAMGTDAAESASVRLIGLTACIGVANPTEVPRAGEMKRGGETIRAEARSAAWMMLTARRGVGLTLGDKRGNRSTKCGSTSAGDCCDTSSAIVRGCGSSWEARSGVIGAQSVFSSSVALSAASSAGAVDGSVGDAWCCSVASGSQRTLVKPPSSSSSTTVSAAFVLSSFFEDAGSRRAGAFPQLLAFSEDRGARAPEGLVGRGTG